MVDVFLYSGEANPADVRLRAVPPAVAYTLALDPGVFACTGEAAGLTAGLRVVGEIGSFAFTGQNTSLRTGYGVFGQVGAFAFSGTDATLTTGYQIVPASGAFALTGVSADLRHGHLVAPAEGAFAWSGSNAALFKGSGLFGEVGAFALSGQTVTFRVGRVVQTDAGAFQMTGVAARLRHGSTLLAESGVFALIGTASTLTYAPVSVTTPVVFVGYRRLPPRRALVDYALTADSGRFALKGQPATLRRGFRVVARTRVHQHVPTSVFRVHRTMAASAVSVVWTGASDVHVARCAATQPGAFGFTGHGAVLAHQADPVDTAWLQLQREIDHEDELLLLGVWD